MTGRLSRVGIDLKTEIEGWVNLSMSDGKHETNITHAIYFLETVGKRLREQYGEEEFSACYIKKKRDHWVSDHFGIAVGIKIRGRE